MEIRTSSGYPYLVMPRSDCMHPGQPAVSKQTDPAVMPAGPTCRLPLSMATPVRSNRSSQRPPVCWRSKVNNASLLADGRPTGYRIKPSGCPPDGRGATGTALSRLSNADFQGQRPPVVLPPPQYSGANGSQSAPDTYRVAPPQRSDDCEKNLNCYQINSS